jgi:ABC-2 type transport system ATP-binding protein
LLLDEPLNGLDARSSRIVKDIISLHAKKTGGAVLFSTHIMEVAEHVCDRIGIIYQGKIVAEGSLDELRGKAKAATVASGNNQAIYGVNVAPATLEEVFLKLTHEEEEIEETIRTLREAFFVGK